ncbi:hypothetical protein [Acinetobacter sp. LoGeW2-3]|uniref:hypothetical protein n=1 Tax=Acinetobacter sp. LoGeW2-3 TaxID=1808001 RepID=UPI001D17FC0D|nr:hypothetical protein [Acinetobacter sp. LoGeW2-3]
MKILNGKEAFEAMMAGRNIMCRAVGGLMDFDDLDRFPATIFAMPGYEFSIKVETMELAGITFAKPLTLDDVVEDQEIFIIHPDHVSLVKYSKQNGEYFACVRNGFAQADNKNAVLQLEAMGKLFGRVICYSPTIDNTGKTKKKRSTKAKSEADQTSIPAGPVNAVPNIEKLPEPEVPQPIEVVVQDPSVTTEVPAAQPAELDETDPAILKVIEAIEKCGSDYELKGVERNLDSNQHKLTETEYSELKNRIAQKRELLFASKKPVTVDSLKKFAIQSEACTAYIDQIKACTTTNELADLSSAIIADDKLNIDLQEQLCNQINEAANQLNQPKPKEEQPPENLSVAELQRLQHEAEKLVQNKAQDEEYQTLLTDLLDRAEKANTPAEANSLVRYTRAWTEEQRKPLLDAIHKRLVQLNDANEQPSLAVRIQRAEDLTELDSLEIDVSACDEVIQPRLMELIEQRRIELELPTEAGEAS